MTIISYMFILFNMKKTFYIVVFLLACLLIFSACNRNTVVSEIKRDDLFSLKYGNFENQLNLFDLADSSAQIPTSMAMKNGFFYIANGESKKVLTMNSYGDLLTLYHNREENPPPLFNSSALNSSTTNLKTSEVATKKIIDYPFNSPSKICVDSKQGIYVVELLPPERQENDGKKTLKQVILRFNNDSFIDYLGQQGPGGTPFPYIYNMYTTANNDLVVICIVPDGHEVFWFSESGYLLHNIFISANDAPNISNDNLDFSTYLKVENIIPDNKDYNLFVKIDYYNPTFDPTSKAQSGVEFNSTYIYPLDATTGKYGKPIQIPIYEEEITQGFTKLVYKNPYDFLGVSNNNWLFFTITTEQGYIVQIVDSSSSRVIKRLLKFDNNKILFQNFSLSGEGIISALLASKEQADVVWWRTDTLLDSLVNN